MNRTFLIVLLGFTSLHTLAEQTRITNYPAARDIFWEQIYNTPGHTFYCGRRYTNRSTTESGEALSVEHIVHTHAMTRIFNCGNRTECRANSVQFNHMNADLHNLYPALQSVNSSRGNLPFKMIPGENHRFANCDFERESDGVEPRPVTRGNIARAYFYAMEECDLQVDAARLDMLKQWNRQDPPNCRELKRNSVIQWLQGTRNRFIDQPYEAEGL